MCPVSLKPRTPIESEVSKLPSRRLGALCRNHIRALSTERRVAADPYRRGFAAPLHAGIFSMAYDDGGGRLCTWRP